MWWKDLSDYILIKRRKGFDPAYYLLRYPDCRKADVDPLWHFVRYGWKEGRNPSPDFDTQYYLKGNPDVRQAGINPLVHYLRYGQKEGRLPRPSTPPFPALNQPKSQPLGLRVLYNLGIRACYLFPSKYRQHLLHWLYSHQPTLFKDTSYRARQGRCYSIELIGPSLVDLQTVRPAEGVNGSIAIHFHAFYADLVKELVGYLQNMPFPYDLYVSVPDEEVREACRCAFGDLPFCRKVDIRQVPNRGRDIAPFLCTFGDELSHHDYVAHLHTKKSLYNQGATEGWREYLYRNLLGSREQIQRIFTLMQGDSPRGIVYPQNYVLLPYWVNTWLANRELGKSWAARLGITEIPRGYFDYPAGSMFWARTDALAPLFRAGITLDDFPEEAGQIDGTLAHIAERLLVLCSLSQGMPHAIILDDQNPSWSPWRFEQYTDRPYSSLLDALHAPHVRLIAFDVFDTLLCRPLLDPETVKKIVARRAGGGTGSLYQKYRAVAEQEARRAKGRDVGLDEIYDRFGEMSGLPENHLLNLQHLEEQVEEALLEPRWQALQLYSEAVAVGKPVVLMTDMFLSRQQLAAILHKQGITGWDDLFVSGEIGLRKDNGELYEHVLARYGLKPTEFLMIGDDERSDAQIPGDMRCSLLHLLRPVELARGLPRLAPIISAHEKSGDVDAELTLGLVLRKNLSPICFPSLDPASLVPVTPYHIGYSLVGPLLVSFAHWLILQARADGIERLYFLSREGKLMKDLYDCWCEGLADAPRSDYLVISRRAAGVAAISTLDDAVSIAKMFYLPNTIENFLYTRYGLVLSDERWDEIAKRTGWDRTAEVSIQKGGKIDRLLPLLQALEADILARAEQERPALLRYLAEKGLDRDSHQAVVDIGYGGSVQAYLNRLLARKVHGYYLMTDDRSSSVAKTYGVTLRGSFCENVAQSLDAPPLYIHSFNIEKLISTVEPQVEYYEIDATDKLTAHYREMYSVEKEAAPIREEIRRGALEYGADARRIRQSVLPDFQPSLWTAQMLLEAFLGQTSAREAEFLSRIVLDDHYCGRGLVF